MRYKLFSQKLLKIKNETFGLDGSVNKIEVNRIYDLPCSLDFQYFHD